MEGLERLVAESLARNGFEIPEPRSAEEQIASGEPVATLSLETRLAAPGRERTSLLEPAPLPSGF